MDTAIKNCRNNYRMIISQRHGTQLPAAKSHLSCGSYALRDLTAPSLDVLDSFHSRSKVTLSCPPKKSPAAREVFKTWESTDTPLRHLKLSKVRLKHIPHLTHLMPVTSFKQSQSPPSEHKCAATPGLLESSELTLRFGRQLPSARTNFTPAPNWTSAEPAPRSFNQNQIVNLQLVAALYAGSKSRLLESRNPQRQEDRCPTEMAVLSTKYRSSKFDIPDFLPVSTKKVMCDTARLVRLQPIQRQAHTKAAVRVLLPRAFPGSRTRPSSKDEPELPAIKPKTRGVLLNMNNPALRMVEGRPAVGSSELRVFKTKRKEFEESCNRSSPTADSLCNVTFGELQFKGN